MRNEHLECVCIQAYQMKGNVNKILKKIEKMSKFSERQLNRQVKLKFVEMSQLKLLKKESSPLQTTLDYLINVVEGAKSSV